MLYSIKSKNVHIKKSSKKMSNKKVFYIKKCVLKSIIKNRIITKITDLFFTLKMRKPPKCMKSFCHT